MAVTAAAEACADCTHPRAYHTGGRDCRSSGCLCERWQGPRAAPMEFPEMVLPPTSGQPLIIGTPRLRYRGEFLDFPTMGGWKVGFGDNDVASVTITVPVSGIVPDDTEPTE